MYFISIPAGMAIDAVLQPGEKVACRNATIIEKEDGSFSGWIDNASMIAFFQREGEDESV